MPTHLKTIAEIAGVSTTTVHRALYGSDRISEETRQRILKVAQELDYRPNNLARGLRSTKSATLGVIAIGFTSSFYSAILEGVEDIAAQSGYGVLIARSGGKPEREIAQLDLLREKRVDGIIVAPTHPDRNLAYYQKLLASGPPFVFIDRHMPDIESDWVMTDNFTGGCMAGRHLISLGRTRIAFACVDQDDMPASSVMQRLNGLKAALGDAGLGVAAMIGEGVPPRPSQQAFARAAAQEFIRSGGKVDAVFAANDVTAIGVVNGLQRMGVSVPDDVAVIGFDDLEIATYTRPALTTIRQPIRRMGEEAVRRLLARISDEAHSGRPSHILLPPELVIRESCGARHGGFDDEWIG